MKQTKAYKCSEKEVRIYADPFGSYTGRPTNEQETPVQDADDL